MKIIKSKKITAIAMLFVLYLTAILTSCGSKKETVDSGASKFIASSDGTTTVITYDEDGNPIDATNTSEEPEGTTTEDENTTNETEEAEILTETVTNENGETVTDENGNQETVTTNKGETEAEEPEGTVTTESEDETEGTSASVNATTRKPETTTTQKSGSSTTTQKSTGTSTTTTQAATTSGYTYKSLSQTMYVKSSVNVRSTPNSSGTKLGSLSAGQSVTVTGQCNETSWYRISYNGGTGYVSNNYLTSTKPTTETTTTTRNSETTTTKKTETTTTTKNETTTRTYATEEEKLAIIEGINNYRASQGYTEMPVVLNTFLTEQAQEWAEYLAANDTCYSSIDNNAMSNLTGDYYWSREYYGEVKLLGKDISYWVSRGENVGKKGLYDCPFIGVGVAMNSAGKTVLVVQGIHQIGVYDSEGYLAYNDIGGQVMYWWWSEDSDGNADFYTENSDFIKLVYKIYNTGHFADYITEFYYTDTYGDNYYKYIPSWIKGSAFWLN